jgi:hypothetical protein
MTKEAFGNLADVFANEVDKYEEASLAVNLMEKVEQMVA